MRPLQLVDVLEYLCCGIHIDRSHDGRVSCISGHSWLGTGFWLGWRMRAISKVLIDICSCFGKRISPRDARPLL